MKAEEAYLKIIRESQESKLTEYDEVKRVSLREMNDLVSKWADDPEYKGRTFNITKNTNDPTLLGFALFKDGEMKAVAQVEKRFFEKNQIYLREIASYQPGAGKLLINYLLDNLTKDFIILTADWSQDKKLCDYYKKLGFEEIVKKKSDGDVHWFWKAKPGKEQDAKDAIAENAL